MGLVEHAWVQVQQPGRPTPEAAAVLETLSARGTPTQPFSLKQLQRGRIEVKPQTLVVGDHDVMRAAFKQLGIDEPGLADYPAGTDTFLRRRLWHSTLAEATAHVEQTGTALFIKPRAARKRFTGLVYTPGSGSFAFGGASRNLDVWCSDAVTFGAEFRAYVCRNTVLGIAQYAGEPGAATPDAFVDAVVAAMRDAGSEVDGFAVDVASIDDGFALVECNDGFALGLYDGIAAEDYTDLLCARWSQLVHPRAQS
jgi:hypothetical protein